MSQKVVSIVTVTYNAVAYLEKTMLSVLSQNYPAVEYIIIDGGSTDGTQEVIRKYENRLAYWISEPDTGIYNAMNKGIDVARGEWIVFMNAGDAFGSEDTLSRAVAQAHDETDILYGASMIVDPLSGQKTYHPVKGLETFFLPQMPFIHQSVLIRGDVMKRYRYREDYRFASDFDFFFRAYREECRYQYIDQVIADFLGGGLHAYHMPQYMAEAINSLVQYHDNPKELARSGGIVRACSWFYREKPVEFSRSLGLLSMQLNEIRNRYGRIVVYGYGSVGKMAVSLFGDAVVAIIDRAVGEGVRDGHTFISMDGLRTMAYDTVVITVLGRESQIIGDLGHYGISEEKIALLKI